MSPSLSRAMHSLLSNSLLSCLLGYLGQWSFTSLKDTKIDESVKANEELSWWRKTNLGENKYKFGLAAICFVVGKNSLNIKVIKIPNSKSSHSLFSGVSNLDVHIEIRALSNSTQERQRHFPRHVYTFWQESDFECSHQMRQRSRIESHRQSLPPT